MTERIAEWFAGVGGPARPDDDTPRQDRHKAVSSLVDPAPPGPTEPVQQPARAEDGKEVYGALHPPTGPAGEALPLVCRACHCLRLGRCHAPPWAGIMPSVALAGRCDSFHLRDGATLGRVWLWRVRLTGGRLVWLSFLPEVEQAEAVAVAHQRWGPEVSGVAPLPGFTALPD